MMALDVSRNSGGYVFITNGYLIPAELNGESAIRIRPFHTMWLFFGQQLWIATGIVDRGIVISRKELNE
jgi:hypothetical protein